MNNTLIQIDVMAPIQEATFVKYLFTSNEKTYAIFCPDFVTKEAESEERSIFSFIQSLCTGFDIKIIHVVISSHDNGVFNSKIVFSKKENREDTFVEIDSKPSTSLPIAKSANVPVYITEDVLSSLNGVKLS